MECTTTCGQYQGSCFYLEEKNYILAISRNYRGKFSLVEDGGGKKGNGDVSSIATNMEDDPEDSVTASSADQREEEFEMFWSYIVGMLTNLESMPLDRIFQTLRLFALAVKCDIEELRAFLDTKVRQHKLAKIIQRNHVLYTLYE